jgi:uroporphyrinogen decarboxylase
MAGKESMTPRERWLAVLTRQRPDRVPMDYWATPEATRRLQEYLGCADTEQLFARPHIDAPVTVAPRYTGPPVPADEDLFGCRYVDIHYASGAYRECVFHPLARFTSVEAIEREYSWPSPDWYDYSSLRQQVAGREACPVRGGGSEPFLIYKNLRGQEQALMDLIVAPEIVHYCLDRLFDLAHENTRRIYEQLPGQVTIRYVAEDLGTQESLLMSPAHVRGFLLPRMKRMIDLAHQAGVFVFHHSDGAIRPVIPLMIEAGIDVLNLIQWRCRGMDRAALKRDFGDRLVFHGGMDNQQTLVHGSVAEVRREVEDNLRILGAGGGYFLAPCHNLQAVSPPENIVAMYDTGYALGASAW